MAPLRAILEVNIRVVSDMFKTVHLQLSFQKQKPLTQSLHQAHSLTHSNKLKTINFSCSFLSCTIRANSTPRNYRLAKKENAKNVKKIKLKSRMESNPRPST